jgi:hypothetical protein
MPAAGCLLNASSTTTTIHNHTCLCNCTALRCTALHCTVLHPDSAYQLSPPDASATCTSTSHHGYLVSVAAPVFQASSCSCDAPQCYPSQLTLVSRDVAHPVALPALLYRGFMSVLLELPSHPSRPVNRYLYALSMRTSCLLSLHATFPRHPLTRWRTPLCSAWL